VSVSNRSYVLYGVMVPYESVEYEQIENYLPGEPKAKESGVAVIYDGMSGNYVAVGAVIAEADEYELFAEPVLYGPNPDITHLAAVSGVLKELGITEHGPFTFITLTHFR
jgi:hypothetical protein